MRWDLYVVAALCAGVVGCGGPAEAGHGVGGAAAEEDTGLGGAGASGATGTNHCGLLMAENQEFCQAQAVACTEPLPNTKNEVCGVALREPPAELMRSSDTGEFSGTGPAQVACFSPAGYPAKPGTSKPVTITGFARIFSKGDESKNLTIEVYTVKRTGGDDDGMPDQLVASAVTTPSACKSAGDDSFVTSDGFYRYECKYEYPGAPSETELLIKTSGDLWTSIYDYNIYIANDTVNADGTWNHNVRALPSYDYVDISQAAMGSAVAKGRGILAGEVHDCGDVRVMNATVAVDVSRKAFNYFSANEDSPRPDLTALGTGRIGLYAGLDIEPGPVRVAAVGLLDGKLVTLGFFKTRVFADALTFVTFRGLRPFQVP
jgi:hypothetical protein